MLSTWPISDSLLSGFTKKKKVLFIDVTGETPITL
jgi:hypothetical protein